MGVEPQSIDKLLGVLHQHACAFIKVNLIFMVHQKILILFISFCRTLR